MTILLLSPIVSVAVSWLVGLAFFHCWEEMSRVFKLPQSALSFSIVFCLLLFASCHPAGDSVTNRTTELRCKQDGLCLQPVGTNSLEGGYRVGDEEVRFDVAYVPIAKNPNPQNFCIRLLNQSGKEFLTSHNGYPPKEWNKDKPKVVVINDPAEKTMSAIRRRDEILRLMNAAMKRADRNSKVDRDEAFNLISEVVDDFVESTDRIKRGEPAIQDKVPRNNVPSDHLEYSPDLSVQLGHNLVQRPFDAHDFLEAVLYFRSGGRQPINRYYFDQLVESYQDGSAGRGNVFSGMQLYAVEEDKSELIFDSTRDFKQEIYLYKKPAPMFMAFGPMRGAQHSAANIVVFTRLRGSSEDWLIGARAMTRNHGTMAEASNMEKYAFCSQFPVTSGFFAWKGDCGGPWGTTHVCNNDTAYQIWHAYGNWNGGTSCPDSFRFFGPSCDLPWSPSPPEINKSI